MMRDSLTRIGMRAAASSIVSPTMRIRILRKLGFQVPWSATVGEGTFIGSHRVRFGERAGCSVDCFLDGSGDLILGDQVRLGARVAIITATHDIEPSVYRRDLSVPTIPRPVKIGRGSWLGTGVTVLPGVTIGEGCVVSAGSVVTRDLPPNGLYAGSPAQLVRELPVAPVTPELEVA